MELKQLDYFLHLANTGSMSQSAKALAISQPTLSRSIAQLEYILQVELFEREHRPLQLTRAGEYFKKHIEQPLADLNQAIQLTQNLKQQQDCLRIGFVASILYGLLPEIISQLRQDLQQSLLHLDIKLFEINSEQQLQSLKSGEIDVGFGRFYHQDHFIKQIFLRHERYVVAVPKHHSFAKQAEQLPDFSLKLSSLLNETFILYHRSPNIITSLQHTDPLLQFFEQKGLACPPTLKVRDLQIALGLVAAYEGITLVPESLKTVRQEQICYIPLWHEDVTSPMFINLLAKSEHFALPLLLQAIYRVYERHGITYKPFSL